MPATPDPVIEARLLTKRYRRDRPLALDRIDLAVPSGSFVAFVGPNGAGKSTLIRCCMGFERPTSGNVSVMGIDSQRDRTSALQNVGYVGQTPGLYRDLSATDHFALAVSLRRGFDWAGARLRLDELSIDANARVGHLSGGQQAQVALALALGTRAPVLLLDEPLASLDPLARRDFMRVVASAVRDEGTTALLASHIVADLAGFCDRLIVLAPAHLMYDDEIEAARRHHAVVPWADGVEANVVGTFSDERGTLHSLVRSAEPVAVPASLDDIVLGYLSASRSKRVGVAA